ncbi:hypothetical protein [Flavobacterium pedocola]
MKQKIFSVLMVLFLVSCQKEEASSENTVKSSLVSFNSDWVNSKLDSSLRKSDENTIGYLFSKEELNTLLENEQLIKFRFVLGLTDGKLDLKTVGVTKDGIQVGVINSMIVSDDNFDTQINGLSSSAVEFKSDDAIVRQHMLNPATAFTYINKWNVQVTENKDLDNVVSYDNLRINHFSIEREVIENMSNLPDFKSLGIVFGINPQGKLTTVLLGLNGNQSVILASEESKLEAEDPSVFDFTKPCPNTCDP